MSDSLWLSDKGIRYVLHPKRGGFNYINPELCSSLTAKGQSNWIGTFISPTIDFIEHDQVLGGKQPTIIHMKNGTVYEYDGKTFRKL